MDELTLLEPLKAYEYLSQKHYQNVTKFFDDLVSNSKIDISKNHKTMETYQKVSSVREKENASNKKYKAIKTILNIFSIICFSVAAFALLFIIIPPEKEMLPILLFILTLILGIALQIINFLVLRPFIKNQQMKIKDLDKKLQNLREEGFKELKSLNDSYYFNMQLDIINQLNPLLHLDPYVSVSRYQEMVDVFHLKNDLDMNESLVYVQSGTINGNPFLIEKILYQSMVPEIYHGHLTIHWQERVHENGRSRTITRTQTLHASITQPKPIYRTVTRLIYGNEAAPNLTFSRNPTKASNLEDKELDKYVKSFDKKLDKMVEEDIKTGDDTPFTKLANTKFEALYNALDRDNEVEFRLLFTPLAQKNLIDILTADSPFGDRFLFSKSHMLNYVIHLDTQGFDFAGSYSRFVNYNYEEAKAYFIQYNMDYFTNLFRNLIPVLAIPLYIQTKMSARNEKNEYPTNVSLLEHEVLANAFDKKLLRHKETVTDLILKTKFIQKDGEYDEVEIKAYSFRSDEFVEHVTVVGGDGRPHAVPVPYLLYRPLEKESKMMIKYEVSQDTLSNNTSQDKTNNAKIYQRELSAYLK